MWTCWRITSKPYPIEKFIKLHRSLSSSMRWLDFQYCKRSYTLHSTVMSICDMISCWEKQSPTTGLQRNSSRVDRLFRQPWSSMFGTSCVPLACIVAREGLYNEDRHCRMVPQTTLCNKMHQIDIFLQEYCQTSGPKIRSLTFSRSILTAQFPWHSVSGTS